MRVENILTFLKNNNIKYDIVGDENIEIKGFSSLSNYKDNTITWIKREENYDGRPIACCISGEKIDGNIKCQIVVENSKMVFFSIIEELFYRNESDAKIGDGSVVGAEVKIGENVQIGCNCSINGEIFIDDNTIIEDCVVIKGRVTIGKRCHIQPLSVIGIDGFGYYEENGIKKMVKHFGGVRLEDDVFIGSHVNIARGTIDDTIIKKGVKIAPSTHIGHNVVIGENTTVICAKLFGSVVIGNNAYVSSSIVRNQCSIGENSTIGMGAVVTKDISNNNVAIGIPAQER